MNRAIVTGKGNLDKFRLLRLGLMSELLTGRVRVPEDIGAVLNAADVERG
jgi:hypothetical protein